MVRGGWIRQYEKNTSKIDYLYNHKYHDENSINDILILYSPDAEVMELKYFIVYNFSNIQIFIKG